jgi:ElaB/YqjD/DUF883 family membrane-anchored ribosome-binding protein
MSLTISRFRTLAQSYGSDLQRWPEDVRAQARALLRESGQARRIVAEARRLDEAIEASAPERHARTWAGESPETSLSRLRQRIAVRIEAVDSCRSRSAALASARWSQRRRWIGMAAAASAATVVGFILGFLLFAPVRPQPGLIALLQPSPIRLLMN